MFTPIRKTGLLILGIIILPVVVYSLVEIGSLRQKEKVIQDIYKNQLDAILYSVNQYSDDYISNLASRTENSLNNYKTDSIPELNRIISEIPSVKSLLQFDTSLQFIQSIPRELPDDISVSDIENLLHTESKTISRLESYLHGGYRKIGTIDSKQKNSQFLIFLAHAGDETIINILLIDPEKFISQLLDPKLQEIAKGKFYISAFRKGEDLPFYTSDKQYNPGKIKDKESFWLLKNYQMGIVLKDLTIEDLSRQRTRKDLILIGLMDFILIIGAWLIYKNITKQVELSQLKSDFVSSVSHEIRTPLALITMYIETLEMGRITEQIKIKEYYNVILNETTRLSGIVNRILNFSQIESNKRKYFPSETDLNETIENAANTFRYSIENKGFRYSFIPDKDLPPLMIDKEAVADAFINLVDNAMKYSTTEKDIVVRTGKDGRNIYLEVEDHGIGISEKNQHLIFDKFYRVTELNLANKVKGSGLGLAIVKHIMDAHNGKIIVKSTLGSGSVFRLLFPIDKTSNT
jgi:two-component system, OmpR family, phosphate regulon sensor histidine kinase PhoR